MAVKRSRLAQKYSRLNVWNKLGFWGSIASVAAMVITIYSVIVTPIPGNISDTKPPIKPPPPSPFKTTPPPPPPPPPPQSSTTIDISRLEAIKLAFEEGRLSREEYAQKILEIFGISMPENSVDPGWSTLSADVEGLDKRLSELEASLVLTPSKALSVALLRRDLEGLQTSYRSDFDTANREIDRLYDLTKWFIGIMMTLALATLGLVLGNLNQNSRQSDSLHVERRRRLSTTKDLS